MTEQPRRTGGGRMATAVVISVLLVPLGLFEAFAGFMSVFATDPCPNGTVICTDVGISVAFYGPMLGATLGCLLGLVMGWAPRERPRLGWLLTGAAIQLATLTVSCSISTMSLGFD